MENILDLTAVQDPIVRLPGGEELTLPLPRNAKDEAEIRELLAGLSDAEEREGKMEAIFERITEGACDSLPMQAKTAIVLHYSAAYRRSVDPTLSMVDAMQEMAEADKKRREQS